MLAITVNSLLDNTTAGDNLTTLREAVIAANANADADMIEFDASLTASGPATIELSQGELTLSNNVGIVGPGAGLLTIDANGSTTSPSRHFTLNAGRVGTISGVMLTGGYVTGAEDGGSIRNLAGDLTLESVVLVGNHTADYGGAIYSSGPLDITSSTLERNTSELTGGAVVITTNAADGLVIKASSFIDNEAGQYGALYITGSGGGSALIVNSTFSGNSATWHTGAIQVAGNAPAVTIINSTITDNEAGSTHEGGGIRVTSPGSITLHNTILAGNTAGVATKNDLAGSIQATSAHNLFGPNVPLPTTGSGNFNSSQPGLAPLGDYGGPTKTHALLPNSPAINVGSYTIVTDAGLWKDQRGLDRRHSTVDIGAVEGNVVQRASSPAIIVYGTEAADGVYLGRNATGQDVISLDTAGDYEFPVNFASAPSITIRGDDGDDAISVDASVTSGVIIEGDDGDDLLSGGGGNDIIRGGLGADTIYGGAGDDTLYGYLDGSTNVGGDGSDALYGDLGTDQLYVEVGRDTYAVNDPEVAGPTAPAPTASTWDALFNPDNTGFSPGWELPGMERLVFNADPNQPNMIRWVQSDGVLVDYSGFGATNTTDDTASVITNESLYYVRRDKFGNKSYYSKDSANQGALVKRLDRLGVGYEYDYGDHIGDGGRLEIGTVTKIRPSQSGETTTYHYTNGLIDTITDPFNRVTNLYYLNNRLQRIELPAPEAGQPRPTFRFEYDTLGFISSITDADNRRTEYAFDHAGAGELVITYPDGGTREILPAIENVYHGWRSQLGAWQEIMPLFNYKMLPQTTDPVGFGYEIDELGRTTTFKYDAAGQVTEMQNLSGRTTTHVRNAAGLPMRITVTSAGNGRTVSDTQFTYTSDGKYNLARLDYIDGTFETWSYDPMFSQVTEHVDQLGRKTVFIVDGLGNTTEVRTIVGDESLEGIERNDVVTQYDYEQDGLVKRIIELRNDTNGTAELSRVTEYIYTNVNHSGPNPTSRSFQSMTYGGDNPGVTGITLVSPSSVSVIARNQFGMLTTVRDEVGRDTHYVYDNLDRLKKITLPNPGDGQLQPVTEYAYTAAGLLQEEKQTWAGAGPTQGIRTLYVFDENGRVEHVYEDYQGAKEALTTHVYDKAGNVTQVTDARSEDTWFAYDALDRLIRVTEEDPDGAGQLAAPVTLLAYDTLGRLIATRDPVSQLTRREYDALGRLTAAVGPLGARTTFAYDKAGQLLRQTDPEGRITGYAYDDAGRIKSMLAPGHAGAMTYQYDSAGNLRFVTNPLNHTSETKYDERWRIIEEKSAISASTFYAYTNANELRTLTDFLSNDTTWEYDGAGRVKSESNELGHARAFKYDAYGRLAENTDRNGRRTTYEYDNLHQLAAEKWYVGANHQRTISYDFDKVGNLEWVSDPSATYDYEFDALSRETGVTQTIIGLVPNVRFNRTYDAASRMTISSATVGGTADYLNSYSYDALSRLTNVTQTDVAGGYEVADKRVDFTYNQAGQFAGLTRYASTTTAGPVASTALGYDAAGRASSIIHDGLAVGSTFGQTHSYTYDEADRMSTYTNVIDAVSTRYTYHADSQLNIVDGLHDDPSYAEAYNYDAMGNRDSISGTAGNQQYTRGINNRMLSDGTYNYEYDNEGNRTRRTHIVTGDYTTYEWDHRNRLVEVTDYDSGGGLGGGDLVVRQTTNYYDALDQWINRSYYVYVPGTGSATGQTVFVHEGGQVALQFDKVGGLNPPESDPAHRYLWGPAVDQLLADEKVDWSDGDADGEVLWALADHLGSVRDVVDSNGDLRIHRHYDAFGEVLEAEHYDGSGAVVSEGQAGYVDESFGFTGRYLDKDTGLQNNLNRWYEAENGRWISEDPIGFAAGDANLYRYVGNEPTGWVDPSGLADTNPWNNQQGVDPSAGGGLWPSLVPLDPLELKFGPIELPWKDWTPSGTDWFGTQLFVDPKTGRVFGQGGNAGEFGGYGSLDEQGNFVPDGAMEFPHEPSTLELAADAGAGVAAKLLKAGAVSSKIGGETAAAARGRAIHKQFAESVRKKPGWKAETRIEGTRLRPDAIDPKGRPVELKPNTLSGRASGARQIQRYKDATGTNGRVIYYDP